MSEIMTSDTLNALLKAKYDFLNAVIGAAMLWWVSSVVLCGSVISTAWLQRTTLRSLAPRSLHVIGSIILVFFSSIVAFGLWAALMVIQLQRDVFGLLHELKVPNGAGYSSTEFIWARTSVLLGTTSFVFVSFLWIGVWHWLVGLRKKEAGVIAANGTSGFHP